MSYVVKVGFDERERRYYVLYSEIPGLNVEADTFEDFVDVAKDLAASLTEIRAPDNTIRFEREISLTS